MTTGEGFLMPTRARRKPTRKGKKPAALAPRTKKPDPASERASTFIIQRQSGVRVTEDTALTLGAVFACVRVISESLAGLPWMVHKNREDGGMDVQPAHDVTWLLNTQPNVEVPAFQWRETIVAHALTWGNGYAEIERDMARRPLNLWLITPDRVTPFRDRDTGRILYEVNNPTGPPTFLEADDMYHLRGLGFDGLVGYSVIQLAARSIAAGIAADQATTDVFANDSTPGGVLTHPGRLSEPGRKNLTESWERRHKGPANRRRVALLEEGMKWEQTGLPPEDVQLIEQRQFTPADICRWFRVPPHKIGDLARATFSNIEHQSIEFVNDTLRPWSERLETEADIKLFGRTNRGMLTTIINLEELKRGDMAAQSAFVEKMLLWGVFSVNDALLYLNRNPIGPDGDKRMVQQNMQLLEKVGEEPPPPPPSPGGGEDTPPDDTPPDDDQPPDDQLRFALRPVFEDAYRRLLLRERDRTKAALQSSNGGLAHWLNKIDTEHVGYVRDIFRPVVASLSIARGMDAGALDAALACVAEQHIEDFKARTVLAVSEPEIVGSWEALANEMAGELIEKLTNAVRVSPCRR